MTCVPGTTTVVEEVLVAMWCVVLAARLPVADDAVAT
jgi:hypothetical protein